MAKRKKEKIKEKEQKKRMGLSQFCSFCGFRVQGLGDSFCGVATSPKIGQKRESPMRFFLFVSFSLVFFIFSFCPGLPWALGQLVRPPSPSLLAPLSSHALHCIAFQSHCIAVALHFNRIALQSHCIALHCVSKQSTSSASAST